MKTILNAMAAVLLIASGGALATPVASTAVNLISNGSFENGLTGWTQTGTYQQYPVSVQNRWRSDNANSLSPDTAGSNYIYFVDDHAVNQGLSQSVFLHAGTYRIGFDAYGSGFVNGSDATFSAEIAGFQLVSMHVSSMTENTWTTFSGLANIVNDGYYATSFLFNTPGNQGAKDIAVDRVYVLASNDVGGVTVPEPASWALFLAGFGMFAAVKRARRAPKE